MNIIKIIESNICPLCDKNLNISHGTYKYCNNNHFESCLSCVWLQINQSILRIRDNYEIAIMNSFIFKNNQAVQNKKLVYSESIYLISTDISEKLMSSSKDLYQFFKRLNNINSLTLYT